MTRRAKNAAKKPEIAAVVYRDEAGKLKVMGGRKPKPVKWEEVRPPKRKRKSA